MSYWSKEARTARALEQKFQKQIELITEMAAAYVAHGKPVPQELGEALGEVEKRRREFQQVKQIYVEQNSGIGVKPIIQKFLERTQGAGEAVKRLLELHGKEEA